MHRHTLFFVGFALAFSAVSAGAGVATDRLRDICRNAAGVEISVPVRGKPPARIFQSSQAAEIANIVACIDIVDPDVSKVGEDEVKAVMRPSVCTYLLEIERSDRSKLKIYVYSDFAVEPSESLHPKFIGVLPLTDESKRRLKECLEKKRANQPVQRNASTGSVSNFESPARRG